MAQKKMAVINDLSGYGRCSLTVQLPLISSLGVQACPVPTGVFSNHTGYESYTSRDLTDYLPEYLLEWKKLGLKFDGICIGYLTSHTQIDAVKYLVSEFKAEECIVILDPVMGDDGRLYTGYSEQTAIELRGLLGYADIVTPNLTEACFLTGIPYRDHFLSEELTAMCQLIAESGPSEVVITGVDKGDCLSNFCYSARTQTSFEVSKQKSGLYRPGTGDIFSGIVAADAISGIDIAASVERAASFVAKCIKAADENEVEVLDGVCFEEFMKLDI